MDMVHIPSCTVKIESHSDMWGKMASHGIQITLKGRREQRFKERSRETINFVHEPAMINIPFKYVVTSEKRV